MTLEPNLSSARIVVVDDENPNVRLLQRVLEGAGYSEVVGITTPAKVFEDNVLDGADLLLLDLRMPPPDGFTILETIRRDHDSRDQLPILILTADDSKESRNRALELGANDYLTKPFDQVEVLLRVRNLLRIRFLHLRLLKTNRLLQDRVLELGG